MRFVHLFTDKGVATLRITVLMFYPIYAILLKVSLTKRKWLIENLHILVGCLLVWCIKRSGGGGRKRWARSYFHIRIYVLHDHAAGKRSSCYHGFKAEKEMDERASRSHDYRSKTATWTPDERICDGELSGGGVQMLPRMVLYCCGIFIRIEIYQLCNMMLR